jgi:hypothetical protein
MTIDPERPADTPAGPPEEPATLFEWLWRLKTHERTIYVRHKTLEGAYSAVPLADLDEMPAADQEEFWSALVQLTARYFARRLAVGPPVLIRGELDRRIPTLPPDGPLTHREDARIEGRLGFTRVTVRPSWIDRHGHERGCSDA